MSRIHIQDVKATIVVDKKGARLLTDSLISYAQSLTEDRDGCECNYCLSKSRARDILDIYFEAYSISKLSDFAIGIPKLKDIEAQIKENKAKP